MSESHFSAVAEIGVTFLSYIAAIVEQSSDDSEAEMLRFKPIRPYSRAFIAVHQARHGECHIKHMLNVVIRSIATMKSRKLATIKRIKIAKCPVNLGDRVARVEFNKNPGNLGIDGSWNGHIDGVGYI